MTKATDPALSPPALGVVDLWPVPLDGDPSTEARLLSGDERQRMARRRGDARARFALSHGAMRRVVAAYQGCAPDQVVLSAVYGQPPRVGGGLELSLAHCDELTLVAVACAAVGVDVEALSTAEDDDLEDLAELTLTPCELATFHSEPDTERPRSWLRSWARKEAVLKAHGEGLADRLMSEMDVAGDRVGVLTLKDLDPTDRHIGAIAIEHSNARVAWKGLQR